MKHRIIFLLLLAGFSMRAQTDSMRLIGLHPSVGKTIDRDEKIRYRLFPQYRDSLFDNAQIFTANDTTYKLVITSVSGSNAGYLIDTTMMTRLYNQIDSVDKAAGSDDYTDNRYAAKNNTKAKQSSGSDIWYDLLGQAIFFTIDLLVSLL